MRVIPFGVSSGRPTSQRNVSGLAVDTGDAWILVDCGEGTQQQVLRSPIRLPRLAGVLITHLHGDHVLGLPGLLGSLGMEGRAEPLPIIGPVGLSRWFEVMADSPMLTLDFPLDVTELDEDGLIGPDGFDETDGAPRLVGEMARCRIEALPLRHRVPCFGYRIIEPDRPGRLDVSAAKQLGVVTPADYGRLQRGESVATATGTVRSEQVVGPRRRGHIVTVLGDTTPCAASVALARDADLLVHEATYGDEAEALGEQWRHSTARQAAGIAADAAARHLVINHFSSRYLDPEVLLEQARSTFPSTELAVQCRPIEVPRPPEPATDPRPAPPTRS